MQLNGQLSSRAGVKQERGNQDCEWISHGSKSFPWLVLRPVNYSANSFSSIQGLELEIKDWSFLIGNLADRARGGHSELPWVEENVQSPQGLEGYSRSSSGVEVHTEQNKRAWRVTLCRGVY